MSEKNNPATPKFSEKHRPQFHFTPPHGWMNDPNGMVYYDGEYHLFYQYYPNDNVWGPMHWGHAISKDLLHWEHLPIALYPDPLGYIFSGSAIVDADNSAGFQNNSKETIVAFFTHHHALTGTEVQSLAFSIDNGKSFEKYSENPVIHNPGIKDFRDPKVFWHEQTQLWIMCLAALDRVHFYNSDNLKDWQYTGEFGATDGCHGGVWECPDVFPLNIPGGDTQKWVLVLNMNDCGPNGGSCTQYFIGNFNGKTFVNDNPPETILWLDFGKDNYAGVTWSNAPDDRRIYIGWMSNWQYAQKVPTEVWRSAMTIPRELALLESNGSYFLRSAPVKELQQLRGSEYEISEDETIVSASALNEIFLAFDLDETTADDFGIAFSNEIGENLNIGYDVAANQFYIDRTAAGITDFSADFPGVHHAPRLLSSNRLTFHIFLDCASVELFADDGSVSMTEIFFPNEVFTQIRLFRKNGTVKLVQKQAFTLKSIWRE